MTDKVFISKENLEKALSFKEKKDVGFFTSILCLSLGIVSKNFVIFANCSVDKESINSDKSFSDISTLLVTSS